VTAGVLSIWAAVGLALLSLLFLKNAPFLAVVFVIYAGLWAWSGVVYRRGKKSGFYAAVAFTVPWILLFGAQFCRRVFYLAAYGGDAPDGMGSPLAFLIGWAFEIPPTVVILTLGFFLLREWKSVRHWSTRPSDSSNRGFGTPRSDTVADSHE
jgi:hypothetical protein